MNVLWLSEADVSSLVDVKDAIPLVEEAFAGLARGEVQMPAKIYLNFAEFNGDLRAMPAYLPCLASAGGRPFAGVKVVNSHPNNPKRGLPTVAAVFVLNDPETGMPLAVMGAGKLTDVRTGAAGGVAAKYLARPASATVGLVGCGRQALTQLQAVTALFSIEAVKVSGQTLAEAEAFCQKNTVGQGMPLRAVEPEEACRADIVVTTTPGRAIAVKSGWIKPGTHINAIGADAPGKQELDVRVLKKAVVVVDSKDQAFHSGEVNVGLLKGLLARKDIGPTLGEVVIGKKAGRRKDSDITVFDSTGLAVQDVAVAAYVYRKAMETKTGLRLAL